MKKINGFVAFLNIIVIILTIGAFIAPYFNPNASSILAIIGLGFPALFIANLAFILYWVLFNIKNCWWSVLILLVGGSSIMNIVNIQKASIPNDLATVVKVANYNMQFSKPVRSNVGWHRDIKESDFKKHLQQFRSLDILCLQEHTTYAQRQIEQLLQLPYSYFSKGKYVAIYSRYPILNKGQIEKFGSNRANSCIWADVEVNGKTIRVYSAHFESNRKDGKAPKKIVETAKEPPVSASMAVGLLRHYKTFSIKRVEQAKILQAHFKESPYPTILCGDMNDTPQTHVYNILKEGQKDTFREKGLGFGATFGSTLKNKLALLRIDYIFTNPSFKILNHRIFPAPFSDHYLIYSKIQLP